MAKLSKVELDALASRIRKDLFIAAKAEMTARNLEKTEEFEKTDLGKKVIALAELEEIFVNQSKIKSYLKFEYTPKCASTIEIKEELVIQGIECTDLADLIKKVTDKFSK